MNQPKTKCSRHRVNVGNKSKSGVASGFAANRNGRFVGLLVTGIAAAVVCAFLLAPKSSAQSAAPDLNLSPAANSPSQARIISIPASKDEVLIVLDPMCETIEWVMLALPVAT